ncbi:MAG: DUF3568 family protein [Francisellaceae bacterium]
MKKYLIAVLISVSVLAGTGCVALVAAGAGAGAVYFIDGTYKKNLSYSLDEVYNASLSALNENYVITSKKLGGESASIEAETKLDSGMTDSPTKVSITIDKLTSNASTIKIRYGLLGDKGKSDSLMSSIEAQLH